MIRNPRVGMTVEVHLPSRGGWDPAKITGYRKDRTGRVESIDVEIRPGYEFVAGGQFFTVEPENVRRSLWVKRTSLGRVWYDSIAITGDVS